MLSSKWAVNINRDVNLRLQYGFPGFDFYKWLFDNFKNYKAEEIIFEILQIKIFLGLRSGLSAGWIIVKKLD